jgi:hypothetical protein
MDKSVFKSLRLAEPLGASTYPRSIADCFSRRKFSA